MTRLLVLQPDDNDPVARLGDWLTGAGAVLDVVKPHEQPLPTTLDGYQGVVCLGGAMGALDDVDHPWLADVRKLLSHAVSKRVPTLAICLGAQLLAAATGGQVRRSPKGPEVGVLLVAKRDAAGNDPLFGELPWTPDVLQFHEDEIALLPPTAELLASSPKYPNQAFRVGDNAYGVQFHIETTPEIVLGWARGAPEAAACTRPGQLDPDNLARGHEDIREVWQPFAERFVRFAGGELSRQRNLPLV
ncbi:GMP synthase-like glutamine amidotransferase [Saccharothrix tamanrassetensis]|uniref:GMP synthase-like glutamine amidotransferase n=1 Tax=Saccharothrix tamanrassetensis TaxID=1051531 RepID=A0A841CMZ5_9PSEU|nr:type 1 glutamine amidotransferase [Saccharothrix tamanrassetensis]MBB5957365.1 GMP synthase-like glutamine amidotransferase [Saccharothrix tamanrassetensis]